MQTETSWSLIEGAARGDAAARRAFSDRFLPVVRAALRARWRASPYLRDLEDAVQEVFVDCFRTDGVLARADPARGGFRSFLFGVVRTTAHRFETRFARDAERRADADTMTGDPIADDTTLSRAFDRAWAQGIMEETARLQTARAEAAGREAMQRVELLRLRFEEGMPIRDIARLWNVDAALLHRDYAKARKEFHATLREVVALRHACAPERLERECQQLIELMSTSQ